MIATWRNLIHVNAVTSRASSPRESGGTDEGSFYTNIAARLPPLETLTDHGSHELSRRECAIFVSRKHP